MITKERLEELIKKDATIYYIKCNNVVVVIDFADKSEGDLKDIENISGSDDFVLKLINLCLQDNENATIYDWLLGQLYETESEAEHYIEYGNIQRTETLSLPSYNEFKNPIIFNDKKDIYELNAEFYTIGNVNKKFIIIHYYRTCKLIFNKPLTEENYEQACEICKKLFLGEEV